MAKDVRLAAVPALAEFLGPLSLFLGKLPLVLPALRGLSPCLLVFPAALACVASLGRGCFLMGAAAVKLLDVAFRLLRTAGPGGRVFRVFGAVFVPGPAALELSLLLWVLPGRGKENSKVRPSTRLGGGTGRGERGGELGEGLSPLVSPGQHGAAGLLSPGRDDHPAAAVGTFRG